MVEKVGMGCVTCERRRAANDSLLSGLFPSDKVGMRFRADRKMSKNASKISRYLDFNQIKLCPASTRRATVDKCLTPGLQWRPCIIGDLGWCVCQLWQRRVLVKETVQRTELDPYNS